MATPRPRLALHWRILIGIVLGTLAGLLINRFWSIETWRSMGVEDSKAYLAWSSVPANADPSTLAKVTRLAVTLNDLVGKLFVRALRFIAIPIVLASLIAGVASLGNPRQLGRVGGRTLAVFLSTGVAAAVLGVALASIVRPGRFVTDATRAAYEAQDVGRAMQAQQTARDLSLRQQLEELITTNPFASLAKGDMLQIVVLAVVIGIGLTLIKPERAAPVLRLCEGIGDVFLELVRLLLHAAPYAAFALIVPVMAAMGFEALTSLAVYAATVIAGLSIILFAFYPAILYVFTPRGNRVTFRRFFRAMAPAQLMAFTSSSSAATLPVTIECTRDRLGVSERITGFVCPLGTTINMDGTALYQAVACAFLAQLYHVDLSAGQLASLVVFATLISIGSPGIPGSSVALMSLALDAFHIPVQGIAIILATDRFLDMCRTIVNISGDAMSAAVVAGLEGELAPDPLARPRASV